MTLLKDAFNRSISCATALVMALGASCIAPLSSFADPEMDELEAQIKASAETYNSAVARQEELESSISELDARILEIETLLPAQKQRSDESVRALYKYEYDSSSMLMMLLDSSSVTDMLAVLDSYTWVIDYNNQQIKTTVQMQQELKSSREQLEQDKAEADEAAATAYSSLQEAKNAREQAAARAAAAQAAEQQAAQARIAAAGGSPEEIAAAAASEEATGETVSTANVGWDADKSAFVGEWAPRIDSYLSGSPLAGTGKYFAAAAWDNGVDPRWAPAISYVESSKGAVCFRSHNAWGYGSKNFSSWEEGIYAVVGALGGSLYGGYLTREAAATYCPPNSENWYNTCAEQMAMI